MDETIRVLLVDGYAVMRDALRALITTAPDMEVVGETAISTEIMEKALQLQPDVIILDLLVLGNDDMTQVVSRIKSLDQTRILVLTNEISEREISSAIDAGVKGFLPKGTATLEILQAIRALHRGESVFDPALTSDVL